ncbi:MAG: hypothetical protein QMB62_02795 [Oscillospiraceae bacterium]
MEGYQLTLQGKAGKALAVACFSSFCGGLLSEAPDKLFVHAASSAKNFFRKDRRCISQGPYFRKAS